MFREARGSEHAVVTGKQQPKIFNLVQHNTKTHRKYSHEENTPLITRKMLLTDLFD